MENTHAMTTAEAIRILTKEFDKLCGNNLYQNAYKIDLEDALWTAITTLRAKQEAETNEPLTLDELKGMVGVPVWVEFLNKAGKGEYRIIRSFSNNDGIYFDNYDKEFGPYASLYLGHYGKTWIAYRHKPATENEPPVPRNKPEQPNPYLIDAQELITKLKALVKTERSTIEIKAKLIPLVESMVGLPSQAGEPKNRF